MQKRRRLDEDRQLAEALRRQADDVGVLLDWARQGESVVDDLTRGLDGFQKDVEAGEIRTMLSGELDSKNAIISIHPRRHRVAGLGRNAHADACAGSNDADSNAGHRLPGRRQPGSRASRSRCRATSPTAC
jgi:hypothetical protein